MPIITLTDQEQADLVSATTLGAMLNLADQARQLAAQVQRGILTAAQQAQQKLAAGGQPAVVADYCIRQGQGLLSQVGKITDANFPTIQAALQQVLGYSPAQSAVVRKALVAGCQRLQATAVDGSTVAQDVAAILANFTQPPLLW
jgi:hypothetical protein